MKAIIEDLARECLTEIYYYNSYNSLNNAINIDKKITSYIYYLKNNPYLGRIVPEIADERFRELIYRKSRRDGYRIVYFVSEMTDTIHILYVANCKQDFNRILKLHNYFNNFLKF